MCFILTTIIFLTVSSNLLLRLIILELIGFLVITQVSFFLRPCSISDFIILFLFSILVIEGVIALSGIITLVSHTGTDIVSSTSLVKC